MQQEQRRADAAVATAHEAELRALRYQLQPHFLFNTLNAISTLVLEEHAREATRMIARLGDFLRATLHGSGAHEVALVEELTLTECYLDIEKARLGERLAVELRVATDTARASVPWLLLQPLVENAIRHGIAPRRGAGRLLIESQRVGGNLRIVVINDAAPMASQTLSPSDEEPPAIGLRNVRKRLQRLYGQAYRFEADVRTDGCYEVRIELPFRTADDERVQIA
jgi:two-component system sensor histidine kinase AlgZ